MSLSKMYVKPRGSVCGLAEGRRAGASVRAIGAVRSTNTGTDAQGEEGGRTTFALGWELDPSFADGTSDGADLGLNLCAQDGHERSVSRLRQPSETEGKANRRQTSMCWWPREIDQIQSATLFWNSSYGSMAKKDGRSASEGGIGAASYCSGCEG